MPTILRLHILVWAFGLSAWYMNTAAQPAAGPVTGRVLRASDGLPVAGANVVLTGTLHGTVTDEDGMFSLGRVRAGRYTLRVTMTGFDGAERVLVVPDDVSKDLVVALATARVDLNIEPLLFAAEALRAARSAPSRGDPYLADSGVRYSRLVGVGTQRFSAAYSNPTVRGLPRGRTGTIGLLLPGSSLDMPGVGILEFAEIVPPGSPTVVVVDPVTSPLAGDALTGMVYDVTSPHGMAEPADAVEAEVGYQSNVDALTTRLHTVARAENLIVVASGAYASGGDFSDGTGRGWEGSFRHGGLSISPAIDLSSRSQLALAGRFVRTGTADLPGVGAELSDAEHGGLAARWTFVPEGRVIRRAHLALGWSRSRADLVATEPQPAAIESWTDMEPDMQGVRASTVLDLHAGRIDRLQSGLVVDATRYEWEGSRVSHIFRSRGPEAVRVSNRRVGVAPFLAGFKAWSSFELALAARLDILRSRVSEAGADRAPSEHSRIGAGLSAVLTFRPERRWEMSVTAATNHVEYPLSVVSPATLPFREGALSAPMRGVGGAGSERVHLAAVRLSREFSRGEVTIRSFFMALNGYLYPLWAGPSRYVLGGTDASIVGVEVDARRELLPFVSASGFAAYHRGVNSTLNEPLPSIYPFHGRFDLTVSAIRSRILLELSSEFAAPQNRLAESLGDIGSDGYVAFHLWLGVPLGGSLGLRTGVYNLFDADYAPRGYAFVPTRGRRLSAPGRSWLIALNIRA